MTKSTSSSFCNGGSIDSSQPVYNIFIYASKFEEDAYFWCELE